MAKCGDKKNPLQRSGTARAERLLPAMQQDYVQVDEKTFAEWIVFAKEYAQYLTYYEVSGIPSGDWSPFFSNDVAAVLGSIAIQDVDIYKRSIKERFDFLKNDNHATELDDAKRKLNELFSIVLVFCAAIEECYRLLPADVSFKVTIENTVKTNLAPALNRLLRYYKAADDFTFLATGDFDQLKVLGAPVKDCKKLVEGNGLGNLWWKQPAAPLPPYTSWKDYYDDIVKDESIFGNTVLNNYFNSLYFPNPDYTQVQWLQFMKINHAANHNLFSGIFDQFLMAFSKLVQGAEKDLLLSLEKRNTHPAHYALFLAFLRLFRFAQDDMNTIGKRHLDFYYKEVLQLKETAALPNSAHIIAELSKPVNDFILADDTLFKAGKDSQGKDVLYALNNETTFNKATIKSLRSVYIGTAKDKHKLPGSTTVDVNNDGRVFAAPMINAADGVKAALTSPNKEWHPIANRLYSEGAVTDINMPRAAIGFAVASHYLYLQEGVRNVLLRLATDNNAALMGKQYALYLTTEKEWYRIPAAAVSVTANNNLNKGTEPCAEFSFTLNGDEPAITNYDAAVHGGTLNVQVPVLKIVLVNIDTQPYQYNSLRNIHVKKIEVAVNVGMAAGYNQQGLKQLLVSTGSGTADTSKPFQPFGGQPKKDAAMVIGNKELFSKKNTSFKLNIEWADIPADIRYIKYDSPATTLNSDVPDVAGRFLMKGAWNATDDTGNAIADIDPIPVFSTQSTFQSKLLAIPGKSVVPYTGEYGAIQSSAAQGYLQLILKSDFGYKLYLEDLSIHLINSSKGTATAVKFTGVEPYVPVIKSLYISYSAYSDVVNLDDTNENKFNNKQSGFFHLYPFGDAEQHAYLNNNSFQYLLPQFRHKGKDDKELLHEGEFYIGFENPASGQSVNILFQIMDGTADPGIDKPQEHINWSYLSDNEWKDFEPQQISDSTLQLIQSGIITFVIPSDASTANTIMPAGYLWLRAAVHDKTDAVCKLLSVAAQAAVVTFKNNENAGDFLNAMLKASSISKLKIPQSAIKKITQPYSSFGGRALESSDAFYVRVSERLRHKARAITIWDYEHLILEAFPQVHKVKCLNHTISKDGDYNEVMPGHVTIITIPDLKQRNDINPLKPFTSQATIKSIDAYLRKKISCHVKLHVVNPLFEEVKLTFKLQLAKGFDDFTIYSNKLKDEITAFLSPWAYGGGEINFGGKIFKSVLINFIEERHYVDFITDVKLGHFAAAGNLISVDNDEISASTSKSILVSKPASVHVITPADTQKISQQYECSSLKNKK